LPHEGMDSKWFEIPATMRNSFSRLDVDAENLSINYLAICKLLTISWRTKKAFVSRIKKVSAAHLHTAPFGLYSIPTKARIFLGPYGKDEYPHVRLVTLPGVKELIQVSSFLSPGSQALRHILPKTVLWKHEQCGSEEEEVDDITFATAKPGYFSCSQCTVRHVPFLVFENKMVQLKHPMGKKLLIFESLQWAAKFLAYIYHDMFPNEIVEWNRHLALSNKCTTREYAYLKSTKVCLVLL